MTFATTTELMAHQREAVAKMLPSRVGALFMDMGTGKSRTAIELARVRLARGKIGRVVWCCPVSLRTTIAAEIIKHTTCRASDVCVFDDRTTDGTLPACLWYIVGLESLGQSDRVTLALARLLDEHAMLVVDESGYIKGHYAKRTRRLTLLGERTRYRLILTGTPISQGVVDLYAQMRFLSPKILDYRSFHTFSANHLEYSERFKGMIVRAHNIPYLAARMAPYVYQVRKDDCLDLPDKIHVTRWCTLTPEQRDAYDAAKEEFLDVPVDDWGRIAIFRLFTRLQTIVCGHATLDDRCLVLPERRTAAVLAAIEEVGDDEKIVIWTKYRRPARVIARALAERWGAETVALFYGDLGPEQRDGELQRWRREARFLVATQTCGGHGLTLTEARTVIFFADGFKYADRLQAEDRCHRIGQQRKVTYVSIRSDAGIDQRIEAALARKENALTAFRKQVDEVKGRGRERAHALVRAL